MAEGPAILAAGSNRKEKAVLTAAALNLVKTTGRSCKSAVVGALALPTSQGSLLTAELTTLTGCTKRYINKARVQASKGEFGVFSTLQRSGSRNVQLICPTRLDPALGTCTAGDTCELLHDCQCCQNGKQCAANECPNWNAENAKRNNSRRMLKVARLTRSDLSQSEGVAADCWVKSQCPSRSGDKNENIRWMTKSLDDFYFDDYRTVGGLIAIIRQALELFGDELRAESVQPRNVWQRNIRTYLEAVNDDALDQLQIPAVHISNAPVDIDSVVAQAEAEVEAEEQKLHSQTWQVKTMKRNWLMIKFGSRPRQGRCVC